MTPEWSAILRSKWFPASVGLTAGVAVAGILVGFVWLPLADRNEQFHSVWDAICSAAGLIQNPAREPVVEATYPTTRVELTPQMLRGASAEAIGRGATLALRCTMCHGARGLSKADTPNLAGQYAVVIYKQLMDFKTGARVSAVMAPLVSDLSDQDMRDLAAYYAYLPRVPVSLPAAAPQIVASGAPLRGIAPCGACHGDLASKPGAAWLEGQPLDYLRTQLQDFASGTRRNDIDEQMRNVARGMTATEIDAASRFYAGLPGPAARAAGAAIVAASKQH
ncbi:MAG TPA: c-type cytochrome [Stellaceae bacterium]|nr:c-type cytochrome [Stellaceae bacterium]